MEDKVAALRALISEVGVVSQAQLAERWGRSRQAVAQLMDHEGAPEPLPLGNGSKFYALPEAEAYRMRRLRAAEEGRRRRGHSHNPNCGGTCGDRC